MNRFGKQLLSFLAAVMVLPACIVVSDRSDPEPTNPTPSGATSSSSSSSDGTGTATTVVGSGTVKSESRRVQDFDRLAVNGTAEVFIEQGDEESLIVEAEDNLLPLLTSLVEGDRLTLGIKPNSSISASRPIIFRLKVKSLTEISATGAGVVNGSDLDARRLRVVSSGTVRLVLEGTADDLDVTISGTGSFDGRNLKGRSAGVAISGAGNAVINASEQLDARISGVGSVRYVGDPKITRRISGLGSIKALE